jgi:hypothetical protein
VSYAGAVVDVINALEAAGLRTAVRGNDITPPVVYVLIGAGTSAGTVLAGTSMATLYVYYIPIRGSDNTADDADGLDAVEAALFPLVWADLVMTGQTSVTVRSDTWPAYRFDAVLAGQPASLASKGS